MVFKNKNKSPQPIINGKFQFGNFEDSFVNINLLEAEKPLKFFTPVWFKNLKLKEWQAFQIGNEKYFILVAVYNAKITGIVQFLIYDKLNNKKYFYKKTVSPVKLKIPNKLHSDCLEYKSSNLTIKCEFDEYNNLHLTAESKNFENLPKLKAEFKSNLNSSKPLVVCIPFAQNRGMYSQKSALKTEGFVSLNNSTIEFNKNESFLIIDDHKGYYPNPMIYDWCTGIKNQNGEITAFNLTDNQSLNPELYNENCIWYKQKVYNLPPVKFLRPKGTDNEWIVKDKNEIVNLTFYPVVENKLKFNYGLAKADYSGPFGKFKGSIKISENEIINLDEFFGMGEKKFVRG